MSRREDGRALPCPPLPKCPPRPASWLPVLVAVRPRGSPRPWRAARGWDRPRGAVPAGGDAAAGGRESAPISSAPHISSPSAVRASRTPTPFRGPRSHPSRGPAHLTPAPGLRWAHAPHPPAVGRVIDVAEHLAAVLAAVRPLPGEWCDIAAARGRVLRHPVHAVVDVPAFDASAMDGFALCFADAAAVPATLRVVADLPAGTADDPALAPGECARIMTGAPVPTDATAVVPFEDTERGLAGGLDPVTVVAAPRGPGAHIRRRGSDVRAGDPVVAAGVRLTATGIGAIAASGVGTVSVTRAARVAVVSTGSELVAPGMPMRRGQIPESNSVLLAGLAEEAGAEVVLRTSVGDEGDGPRRAIAAAEAVGADVVVFSGGVSAGAYEVVKNTLGDLMRFDRVRMQPGKPQGFGVTPGGVLLFGLPGNPVSAAVSFDLFVRPALRTLEGDAEIGWPSVRVALAGGWRARPDKTQYVPVSLDRTDPAAWIARATERGPRGLGAADGLAVLPPRESDVAPGEPVTVTLW
ncbi:hypothetical protein LUZ63_020090 [Rhynchospora breviuscula]|uniref:Molybdopterin biosynthesis protein CNX1 n=1 Tax=Rhynchospora breviuscula TaxID=2022672 RepID=A0A9P9Z987_9POAL|nr:hypothetical protein LUZ63_020090 [Rhynchospora breviuscula]